MSAEADAAIEDRLTNAVERLSAIQKSVLHHNREAHRIRMHIKDFDVNMDALSLLVTIKSKDEDGSGRQVLEDLTKYARWSGMQIDATEPERFPDQSRDAVEPAHGKPARRSEERKAGSLGRLLAQVAAAMAVTTALFVLIH